MKRGQSGAEGKREAQQLGSERRPTGKTNHCPIAEEGLGVIHLTGPLEVMTLFSSLVGSIFDETKPVGGRKGKSEAFVQRVVSMRGEKEDRTAHQVSRAPK